MRTTGDPSRAAARRFVPLCGIVAALLAGCGGGGGGDADADASALQASSANAKVPPHVQLPWQAMPTGVRQHGVTRYPATTVGSGTTAETQDLLTGGIGKTGLGAAAAPAYVDAGQPTAAELRRNALYSNYRGILDPTVAGGYGRFYGPNIRADGTVTADEGLVPGVEYVASLQVHGRNRMVMAVLVPDSFDADKPCLVLGPSSGSRGVYGAIGTAGEWGLKRGCAVALTDTGKGVGLHDLGEDGVNRVDGTWATRAEAGTLAHFAASISGSARAAFNALLPDRFAIKHAHSQANPEKDWGEDTLTAAGYAFYVLNKEFARSQRRVFLPSNTLVIAGSASNGGAAVLRAAELDRIGLIDGVVTTEPVAQMPGPDGYGVAFNGMPVASHGRSLADYTTYGNLYQPCAALAADAAMAEVTVFNYMGLTAMTGRAAARCASLAAKGLVNGATLAEQAADALARLRAYGWTVEHDQMHNAHWGLGNGPILSAMYPVAYGRFSVVDNVCSTSFAAVDAAGNPVPAAAAVKAQSFALANGTANGTPATPVHDHPTLGSKAWQWAVSPSTGAADFGLDYALCQRALVTGKDPVTGAALGATSTPTAAQSAAVRRGMAEVTLDGNLHRKPVLVVSGRSDALVPVNHNARAYAALNRAVEGSRSRLRYIEVTHAQHFDAFLPFSGFDNRYVPLHVYFNEAMDRMYAHLVQGEPLPPSQVVRTTPRGGAPSLFVPAPALAAANIPPISDAPPAADRIHFTGTTLHVPQ